VSSELFCVGLHHSAAADRTRPDWRRWATCATVSWRNTEDAESNWTTKNHVWW